ncbi:MAG: T9SS type A sorting domain-containing protein [Ignavibacteria bacterium]
MKKCIVPVLIMLCIFTSVKNSSSQINFFDSVKTVVSSTDYDYKNPVFNNRWGGEYTWLVYERHNGNSSDIVVRKAQYSSYDNEIVITNSNNALNINPSIDQGMIVWQSNERGNWDIYYSLLIGDIWSAPILLDSSSADETNPYIKTFQNNFSYLAYKRDSTIRFKKYRPSTNIWDNDTLVSDGAYDHISPVIAKGNFSNQYGLVFLRKYPGDSTKITQRIFYENNSGGPVAWENVFEIQQPNPQRNLSYSYASSEYLTYSYDTLNSTHILIFTLTGQNIKGVVTKNIPGKHLRGKGSWMPIITDEVFFQFSAFSVLSEFSDSLCFVFINRPGTFNNNPQYKKLYLGDTSIVTNFDVSQPIFNQSYFYRIKTVWERTTAGKTELVESYMTDYLSEIENHNSNAEGYYLSQNYPNPFNPLTIINYKCSMYNDVLLKVFDVLGNEVAELVNEKQNAGSYLVEFDGSSFASGVYFYKLSAGDFTEIKKMILIK